MARLDKDPIHVTLKLPVSVKLSGIPSLVRCFDGTFDKEESTAEEAAFRVVKIWWIRPDGSLTDSKIRSIMYIPQNNIAGVIAQPFDK